MCTHAARRVISAAYQVVMRQQCSRGRTSRHLLFSRFLLKSGAAHPHASPRRLRILVEEGRLPQTVASYMRRWRYPLRKSNAFSRNSISWKKRPFERPREDLVVGLRLRGVLHQESSSPTVTGTSDQLRVGATWHSPTAFSQAFSSAVHRSLCLTQVTTAACCSVGERGEFGCLWS